MDSIASQLGCSDCHGFLSPFTLAIIFFAGPSRRIRFCDPGAAQDIGESIMPFVAGVIEDRAHILFAYQFASASRTLFMNRPQFPAL